MSCSRHPGIVLVVGATGKVGRLVVKDLRSRDIPVRVLIRSRESSTAPLLANDSGIEVVVGDVTDAQAVNGAVKGVVAVVDVHGVAPKRFSRFSDLWQDPQADSSHPAMVNYGGVKNIVAACQEHNVKHLVRLTGLTVAMPAFNPVVTIFNMVLSFTTKWHRRSEMLIRDSGLCYTVVQPSGLRDTGRAADTGDLLLLQCESEAASSTLPPATGIARSDVAALCVLSLFREECRRTTLRCVSVPKDKKPLPKGVLGASDWEPLLETVKPDNDLLWDQPYGRAAAVGSLVIVTVLSLVGVGCCKLCSALLSIF